MPDEFRKRLESEPAEASAPCRIDMGGTLDISTFYYPLRHLSPCTFNIAINLRTRVRLLPHARGKVKISSRGFESAEYPADAAPFAHPLGLMFAVAAYFGASGVRIDIDSASPPRSALGGSSAAAVALVAAFEMLRERKSGATSFSRENTALLAHALEESVAGVPCGLQDQLAAAYGGVNAWYWPGEIGSLAFSRQVIGDRQSPDSLRQHLLLAYCGIPHESRNINGRWVEQFLSGKHRGLWAEIIECTQKFVDALSAGDIQTACGMMNRETGIRRKMTPDVLEDMGENLARAAIENKCGARFTGAGGGGCIWALGETDAVRKLRAVWTDILSQRKDACLLDAAIDSEGLMLG